MSPAQRRLLLGVLAALAFGLSLVVQSQVVPLHSNNKDEGVYLFQARMFQQGTATLDAAEHGESFRPWLSGERDGRIFLEYQPGFAAFLAVADGVLGSWRLALAAVAAGTVLAVDAMTRRLLGDPRCALVAAAFAALSPMLVLHSALVLTYGLTVLLLTGAAWALLVAADEGSRRHAAIAGALAGAATTIRPLDVLLLLIPFAALAAHRQRRSPRGGGRALAGLAAISVVAALPFVLALLGYNARTTGSITEFPNMAADPLNRFGFGTRRLVETEPTISYSGSEAVEALWANVAAVPSWLFGGPLLLVLAVVGLIRRGDLGERLTLAAAAVAFPAAYLFWWATKLSGETARNGIGPHYYVPAFVVLAVLAARGATSLPWTRVTAAGAAVLLVGATAWAVPDKLAVQREDTAQHRVIHDLPPDDLTDAVVVVDNIDRPYLLAEFPFLRPDPALDAEVLYAVERGAPSIDLADRFPDRDLYRLRPEMAPGDDLFAPQGTFRALELVAGAQVQVTVTPQPGLDGQRAVAYLEIGGERRELDLGTLPTGTDRPIRWTIAAPDEPAPEAGIRLTGGADETVALIGIEFGFDQPDGRTDRVEIELDIRSVDGELRALTPGRGWYRTWFPDGPADLAHDVDTYLAVDVRAAPLD